jgi:ElaB/YqjD/DUF883 family membrane-anchored ribosome-binding protein
MNDTDPSITACKAEAEAARVRIASALGEIQERLSPRNLMHDAMDAVTDRGAAAVENARRTVSRHPIAISIVGAAAGAMLGMRAFKSNGEVKTKTGNDNDFDPRSKDSGSMSRRWSDVRSKAGHAREAVGEKVSSAKDYAAERYHSARDYSAEKWEHARDRAGEYAERTREGARRARERTAEGVDSSPLTAALVGAAVGAIVGALLPRTRSENQLMGSARDRLADTARSAAQAARDAGKARFDELGIKDRAAEELKSLRGQVGDVARSAGEAARSEVRSEHGANGAAPMH